jgi:hypothetical protein
MQASRVLSERITETPFVVYGTGQTIVAEGATVLAQMIPSYFNRTFRHYSSHHHTPDNPDVPPIGPAVTATDSIGYVAYPIFSIYHAMGQPLYRHVVGGLIHRLMNNWPVETNLPTSGRVTLTRQDSENRHILHLLYGAPQVRGKRVPWGESGLRVMEMIEDIPTLGPVTASVRLDRTPSRVVDLLNGAPMPFTYRDGRATVTLPSLRIHGAIAFEG